MWVVYTNNRYSDGAKALAVALNVPYRNKELKYSDVINWGSTDVPRYNRIVNSPEAVMIAVNKLKTFNVLENKNIPIVQYTTDRNQAMSWLSGDKIVYCRQQIAGHGGEGILIVKDKVSLPNHCPMYTLGIEDSDEYRVHVMFGKVIDVSKKLKPRNAIVNPHIRNYNNGWVYGRNDIVIPRSVTTSSLIAVKTLELDFGAVDILHYNGKPYILEVNTAPGIQGTTLNKYVENLRKVIYG